MAKSKKSKVEEAVEEIKEDLTASYHEMCSELGKKATVFQRESKVSSAKHLRNAIRAIRFVIEELEK
jgi:excinuclease UvrABC nuclease subunit